MKPRTRNMVRLLVAAALIAAWVVYWRWASARSYKGPPVPKVACDQNLRRIGMELRLWASVEQDRFPWQVSTNAGGTLEFCATDSNGVDRNVALHLRVLAEELQTPRLLVCPQDKSRVPAKGFAALQSENITYQLRTGTNVSPASPRAIMLVCPIDGNTLYCDGTLAGEETNSGVTIDPDGRMRLR
jgi:hypothetical protein